MIVNVTQKHIDNAKPGCSNCPVALAVRDAYDADGVDCGNTQVFVYKWGVEYYFRLPDVAKRATVTFDNKLDLNPFVFELPELNNADYIIRKEVSL